MIRSTTALILLEGNMPGGAAAGLGAYIWFNIFLFSFLAVIGSAISYLMLRLKRKWRTIVALWSLILFFPIYYGIFYELVEKEGWLLFFKYSDMISWGYFGATLIGIQLAMPIVAWLIGYDWLRGQRRKLSESTVRTSSSGVLSDN